jgi:hypothetical protein
VGGHQLQKEPLCDTSKSVAALQLALGSLPNETQVEVDPDIEVSAKTVGDLRNVAAWPANLAVVTPIGSDPQRTIATKSCGSGRSVRPT